MLKVGITGGIGAGKSSISKKFNEYCGISVYDSDSASKNLVNFNSNIKKEIINLIGLPAYETKTGFLNTLYVADKIFNDESLRLSLQKIVAPYLWDDFDKWCKNLIEQGYDKKYVLFESAIIIDSNLVSKFDSLIVVVAEQEIRIERLIKYRNFSRESALKRIDAQISDSKRIKHANFIIHNDKDIADRNLKGDELEELLEKENKSSLSAIFYRRANTLKKRIEQIDHKIKYISYDTNKKR